MSHTADTDIPKEFESRLIPILREAVEMVKLICYARLRPQLDLRHPELAADQRGLLAGAVINELFGTPTPEGRFQRFVTEHRLHIDAELQEFSHNLEELRIPVTDALRVQYVCDRIEKTDSADVLRQADRLGILLRDREVPMPAKFVHLVRTIGTAYGLLAPAPPAPADETEDLHKHPIPGK